MATKKKGLSLREFAAVRPRSRRLPWVDSLPQSVRDEIDAYITNGGSMTVVVDWLREHWENYGEEATIAKVKEYVRRNAARLRK